MTYQELEKCEYCKIKQAFVKLQITSLLDTVVSNELILCSSCLDMLGFKVNQVNGTIDLLMEEQPKELIQ